MALTGLQADWEIGKFGIGPSSVAAAKKALAGVPKEENVAPSIYSGGGGPTKPSGPNPAVQSAREQIAGKPAVSLATGGAWDMTGGKPAQASSIQMPSMPDQPARQPKPMTSVKDGWASTPNPNVYGGRVLSMGRPGEPNSGTGYVSGPARSPRQQMGMKSPGYSFEGSAADAAKFFAPVSRPAPTPATLGMQGGDYRQVRAEHEAGKVSQVGTPQYLGPESGLGWHTREKLYETQMDAYNKATGNKTQMDIASMQEGGAGRRALLAAQGINDRNAIDANRLGLDQQRMNGEIGMQQLDMQGKQADLDQRKTIDSARAKLSGLEPGTPEFARQERLLATLSGQYGKEVAPKYQTLDKFDNEGNRIGQTLYDQTTGKIVDQGGAQQQAAAAPASAIEFLKKNPNQADNFKKKYGYLPDGF